MNSRLQCCLNKDCAAFSQYDKNTIVIHSQKSRRYKCKVCKQTFSERKGTAFYGLHKSEDLMSLVVTLLAFGCPLVAIQAAFDLDIRTVRAWGAKAGEQGQKLHQGLVWGERNLGQVQVDEFYVKMQGGKAWVAMSIAVASRLWLGCSVRLKRNKHLIYMALKQIYACISSKGFLLVSDGFSAYVKMAALVFSQKLKTGLAGRPKRLLWENFTLIQVVKSYTQKGKRWVCHGAHHLLLALGSFQAIVKYIKASQNTALVHTAYIERLNATFRMGLAVIMRKNRYLLLDENFLEKMVWLKGSIYNFCTPHTSLSKKQKTSPAMKAGITNKIWSTKEFLGFCTISKHTRVYA